MRLNYLSRFSLRSITIVMLVVLSMALVLVSWEVYRELAYRNQRQSLSGLIASETRQVLARLEDTAGEAAFAAQYREMFRDAYRRGDMAMVSTLLGSQFHQYFVTAGELDLVQLAVYDLQFGRLADATLGKVHMAGGPVYCPSLLEQASARRGPQRLAMTSRLCIADGAPYFSVVVPIGGLQPVGYLQMVADPVHNIKRMSRELGENLRVFDAAGHELYRSPGWLDLHAGSSNSIVAAYTLTSDDGAPALTIETLTDVSVFNAELTAARNVAMAVAGLVTLGAVFAALFVLQATTLLPLKRLTQQLQRVRWDRTRLTEMVGVSGNAEVTELATVFNEMSSELARLYDQYEEMAFSDALTKLPNRALFQQRIDQLLEASRAAGQRFAVLLLDLDGFKEVNDTLGHQTGDQLLTQVGQRLRKILRNCSGEGCFWDEDTPTRSLVGAPRNVPVVARLGGDEFAILLPELHGLEEAVDVARYTVEILGPRFSVDGLDIGVSGSLGIALFPDHGDDSQSLVRRADVALYAAKRARLEYTVYDPAFDQNSVAQLTLKAELRDAIGQGELVLHYQPKLEIHSGQVRGMEALVRWNHPSRGLLPPSEFVPLFEQRGLITPMTDWVLAEAMRQMKLWQRQGLNLRLAVNLSSSVLYDLELPCRIAGALEQQGLSPALLELEITEEATMVDPERALRILAHLDAMGIRIAIDDFGIGYSSLAYLKRLPVDEIKIDKSFVLEMADSESDATIVRATIDLAHNLGLKVVAEGVEDQRVFAMLEELECDIAQGYCIGRPMPADHIPGWLSAAPWNVQAVGMTAN